MKYKAITLKANSHYIHIQLTISSHKHRFPMISFSKLPLYFPISYCLCLTWNLAGPLRFYPFFFFGTNHRHLGQTGGRWDNVAGKWKMRKIGAGL